MILLPKSFILTYSLIWLNQIYRYHLKVVLFDVVILHPFHRLYTTKVVFTSYVLLPIPPRQIQGLSHRPMKGKSVKDDIIPLKVDKKGPGFISCVGMQVPVVGRHMVFFKRCGVRLVQPIEDWVRHQLGSLTVSWFAPTFSTQKFVPTSHFKSRKVDPRVDF